jgi:DNA-binding response OmpR family regulator
VLVRIVEDTAAIAIWLADALSLQTEDVQTVTTTGEFGRLLRPEPWEGIDAALVDVMLPEVSGIDILHYLAEHHPQVKTICMTASLPSASEATGLADRVLVKPFSMTELLTALGLPA